MTTKGGSHEPERPSALPAKAATADLGTLVDQLVKLGLDFAAEALPAILTRAVKEDLGSPALLEQLLRGRAGAARGAADSDVAAALGPADGPDAGELRLRVPAGGAAVEARGAGDLCLAPGEAGALDPGPARSRERPIWLSSLGVKAVECGFSVAFFRLEELLHAMRKDAEVPPTRLKGKKYMKAGLVIIDEVGFETFTREEANLFFRLVSYRYQRGSLCITSNKAIKDWPEMLAGDEVITTAILDRLLHSCHVLNIRGRSYRLRDLEDDLNGRS